VLKEGLKPTRMELLNTKQKLQLAEKGYDILKKKRDALVIEFFALVKHARDLRSQLDSQVAVSFKNLALAEAFHGKLFLETASLYSREVPGVEVSVKNVMGVRIPSIRSTIVSRTLLDRGYDVRDGSAKFDECVESFENALNTAVKLAETESALKRLLKDIEKTNRRVNALEFNVQPELRAAIKEIGDHLNRLESERFFALKLTKQRLQRKKEMEES